MYKRISGDSTPLTEKERYPKRYLDLFFEGHLFLRSRIVATPLGMSRAKFCIRLKWPNVYLCFAWSCCLFVYLCLMGCCMIFWCIIICCLYCLLKSFPNCHSVCHLMANSPTHSLKSLNHFQLTVKDKPCRSNQHNVHYITSWEV